MVLDTRFGSWRGAGRAASIVALTLALGSGAQADLSVLFMTSSGGTITQIAAEMAQDLTSRGVTVQFGEELAEAAEPPTTVVIDDDRLTEEPRREALRQHLRQGGGIVLLVGPSSRHYEQANLLLTAFDAQLVKMMYSLGPLRLGDNPVTGGLELAASHYPRVRLEGAEVVPLAWTGNYLAFGQIRVEEGGLIVLPASLIAAGLRLHPPDRSGVTLAVRACSWANRTMQEPLPSPPEPPRPTDESLPASVLPPPADTGLTLESADFSEAVLYDCQAADDHWPEINGIVQRLLENEGLPVKALRVGSEEAPLTRALESEPPLVVLGSWRQWEEREIVALYYYLCAGGRVLALANATTYSQVRLVYLNQALYPAGFLVSLGRPAGLGEVAPSALQEEIGEVGELPGGIQVWGEAAQPVVRVGSRAAMGMGSCEVGRLLTLDAAPLRDNTAYRRALREGIRWLISEEK